MLSRLARMLIVLALAASIGLHWALLQSIAWVSMVVSYSQSVTVREALVMTFDGQHPCKLCKQVAAGKKTSNEHEQQFEAKKLTFVNDLERFVFFHPDYPLVQELNGLSPRSHEAPPFPPPRPA